MNISFYSRLCDKDICPAKVQPGNSKQQHKIRETLHLSLRMGQAGWFFA